MRPVTRNSALLQACKPRLAPWVWALSASRHRGVSLPDIPEEFGVNQRTAQRMVRALQNISPSVTVTTDNDRWRRCKLRDTTMIGMQGIYDRELVALKMSSRRAERKGAQSEVEALQALRGRLMATL